MSTPKKRRVITLDDKKSIIEAAKKDFISIDELVRTTNALSLAKIVPDISRTEEESSEGSGNEAMEVEAMEVKKPISCLEAQSAFAIARHYVERNSDDHAVLSFTDALDEYFYEERRKKQMQPKITSYFLSNR